MMLQALYDLAQREGLLEDPDFEVRPVHYLIVVGADGAFRSLVPRLDERGRPTMMGAPRAPKRAVAINPGFLLDNAKYVLGLGDPDGDEDDRARDEECAEAFAAVIANLASRTKDAGATAVEAFLRRRSSHVAAILQNVPREQWAGSEWVTFALEADGTSPVFNRPSVRAFWSAQRATEAESAGLVRCLVSGSRAPLARLHNSVKRVPGAQTSGASLVSFNSPSFESYGLKQGANAQVGRAAAEGYVTGLNWLLEGTPERAHRYGVRVADDTVMVFWTKQRNPFANILLSFFEPAAEEYQKLVESPFTGIAPGDLDSDAFYAVTLAGNAARVVVRDWYSSTVAEVKANVQRYFADLHIGNGPPRPVPMNQLLKALESPGGGGLAPGVATKLFHAALHGTPVPREVLGAALRRLRLPRREKDSPLVVKHRCSLIKATLLRMPRSGPSTLEVTVSLDEKNVAVPYLLGRLFAVLERLQEAALPGVNATIRDRYFGAAMAHPAVVFPRLLVLSNHHAGKAENAGWLERTKGTIVGALPAERFPNVLALEDQGLFAIGYFHQREKFFEKRSSVDPTPAEG